MLTADHRRTSAPRTADTTSTTSTTRTTRRSRPAVAPNSTLRALLAETGWTQAALARAVGLLGAEAGVRLSYDRASVAHWLRGSRPAPRIQGLIAEALSRRLGRPVQVTQLGMGDGRSGGLGPRRSAERRTAQHLWDARELRHADTGRMVHMWDAHDSADAPDMAAPEGTRGAQAATCSPQAPVGPLDAGRLAADQLAALTAPVVGPPRADAPPAAPYRLGLLTGTTGQSAGEPNSGPPGSGSASPSGSPGSGSPGSGSPGSGGGPGGGPVFGDVSGTGSAHARPVRTAPHGRSPGVPGAASSPVAAVAADGSETPEPLRPRPSRVPFPSAPRGGRPPRRTTPGEVASVREHVRFFAQQADRHGGGHIRTPLAACLSGLVRQLRTGGEGPHHPQLLAGAARLSYLLARVYADERRHGLAQRAFLTAADLAAEGGDPEGVALTRRALSSQAYELGHRRQSLALAESAVATAPGDAAPSARAFLYAGLAVAKAAGGERTGSLDALRRAEYELARTPADLTTGPESPNGESVGGYQGAALLYQSSQVHTALGDREGAIRDLRASLCARPEGERRTRALSHAGLAQLLLAEGELEEACAAWQTFLQDCALVRSGRARQARDRMPRLLRPYARERCVSVLLTRAGLRLDELKAE